MKGRFCGKNALVTGGASGIGRATVERLATEGATVLLCDWSEIRGAAVAQDLRSRGLKVIFQLHDAGDQQSWDLAHNRVTANFGKLDVLVNNAYSGVLANVRTLTADILQDCLRVNVDGALMGMRAADALMTDGGAVVNLSSVAAFAATTTNLGYATAKLAILQLTRSAALSFANRRPQIRVNAVAPGAVDTPALRSTIRATNGRASGSDISEALQEIEVRTPLGRIARPEEIAAAITFLASADASYITGHCLITDGGLTLTSSWA